MRQKIGIIQALQHDPELAILDEPTEGLDPLMQRAFYEILDDLRAAGRTIFFSSHVLSEVERVCDRVAIVRRGRLVALEDVASLLEHRKRNVEMRVADGAAPALDGVPGVSGVARAADGRLTCQLEGDVGPFLAAIAGHRITDLTIEPAHLEEAFLELYEDAEPGDGAGDARGGRAPADRAGAPVGMNRALFGHVWRSNRTRLLIVCVAMAAWSVFLPVIYASFGQQIKQVVDSGIFPKQLDELRRRRSVQPRRRDRPRLHPPDRDRPDLDLRRRVHDGRGRRRAPARHARGRPRPAALAPRRCTRRCWWRWCCSSALVLASSLVGTVIGSRGRRASSTSCRSSGCRCSG